MNTIGNWWNQYRRPIGYTVGGLNLLMGFVAVILGDYTSAAFWLLLGGAIVLDARSHK